MDDSPLNRKMVLKYLSLCFGKSPSLPALEDQDQDPIPFQLRLDEAQDGQEAVEKVEALLPGGDSYDAILMDYQMPRMNGVEAIRRIRDLGFSGLVLGLTGNALKSDIDTMEEAGANGVLTKPVDMEMLKSQLVSTFRKHKDLSSSLT